MFLHSEHMTFAQKVIEGDNNFDKKTQICRNCHKRHEGVQKVFGTLDLFVSLLETEIKYPILQGGILPFWTPS